MLQATAAYASVRAPQHHRNEHTITRYSDAVVGRIRRPLDRVHPTLRRGRLDIAGAAWTGL